MPPGLARYKKLAQSLGDSMIKGDMTAIIDHTYPALVKMMGGREKVIESIESKMKQMKAQGISITAYNVGDPGEFLTEGPNTFVIIPATIEIAIPDGKLVSKTYLLGVSPDSGKTWTFVDGAGVAQFKDKLDMILPKLPMNLKLPEAEKPKLIKNK